MIADIIKWSIYGVVALYMIYFQFVRISSRWQCRKKHYLKPVNTCHEDGCKFASCCCEYEYLLSDEEAEEIEKLIDELKKDNNKKRRSGGQPLFFSGILGRKFCTYIDKTENGLYFTNTTRKIDYENFNKEKRGTGAKKTGRTISIHH